MPIANCIITSECSRGSENLIDLWARESKISSEHMTINIVTSSMQFGNKYKVMADLLLPSISPGSDISSLQVGLAKSLSQYFSLNINEVHVITRMVSSGMVVESGKEISW